MDISGSGCEPLLEKGGFNIYWKVVALKMEEYEAFVIEKDENFRLRRGGYSLPGLRTLDPLLSPPST